MSDERIELPDRLRITGVVAIVRASVITHIQAATHVLVSTGLTCIEFAMTMPNALQAIKLTRDEFGTDACIGAGTVLTALDATRCLDAGAEFLIAPSVVPEVVELATAQLVPTIPGALTATEIVTAWAGGASAVKLFPAVLGGVRYLRDIRVPLPHVPLIPTGGIAIDSIEEYIAAGAVAVGIGSPLLNDCLENGDMSALGARAARALAAVGAGRDAA